MDKWYRNKFHLLLVAAVLLCSFCAYLPALGPEKQFTNWDDPDYVTSQPLIRSLAPDSIAEMFNPSRSVSANYHPLAILSLAVNYHFSELQPRAYFLTNILFHVLNTFLVFILVFLLSGRKFFAGIIAALLFGIHPMHVESVAWLAERKDVLYAFFFFLSCISYFYFAERKRAFYLWIAFLFFIFSCLSKAMAVVLPVILLLIDYLQQRKITGKALLEKTPFFIAAVFFGLLAIHTQAAEAMNESNSFSLLQKLLFASFSFCMYLYKFFLPLSLSGFYPYPDISKGIPVQFYFFPLIALALLVALFLLFNKNGKGLHRIFVSGMLFFIVCLLPVLQFIAVGGAIMADRYTYVSYTGLFFIAGMYGEKLFGDKVWRMTAALCLVFISAAFGFLSFQRVSVWNNSEIFWTDVIKKSGQYIEVAHLDRGTYYAMNNMHEKALADFEMLEKLGSQDGGVYVDLGNEYVFFKKFNEAIEAYSKALALNAENRLARLNRGSAFLLSGQYQKAIGDFDELLKKQDAFALRAAAYRKKAEEELQRNK